MCEIARERHVVVCTVHDTTLNSGEVCFYVALMSLPPHTLYCRHVGIFEDSGVRSVACYPYQI
jgi:hypothetical protein